MKTRLYLFSLLMFLAALPAWAEIKILHGPYLQTVVIFMQQNARRCLTRKSESSILPVCIR